MAKANILVVEDNAIIAMDLESRLKQMEFSVPAIVHSGEQAIEMAKEKNPDLVLMDIDLKGEMNGIEAADHIRSQFNIPVIYLTANADGNFPERAKTTEPFGYMIKPFEDMELYIAIEIALQKYKAGEALRKSEEKYRHLVEFTVDWVWSCDIEGRQTYSNKAVEHILGYEVHEILNASAFSLMHPEYRERVQEWMRQAVEEKRGWKGTVTKWRHKNGSSRFLETTAQPILDAEGNLTGFSGIDRDVTERKKAIEEKEKLENKLRQARKMEAIGALAGGIVHDFNNILFPILGYAEMMLDDTLEDRTLRDCIHHIVLGAKRARDLVKQILTFSRQTDQELKPLKVQLIVKEALKLSRSTLPSTIEIIEGIGDDCGLMMADATQIHQIVMNLITNAYYAMHETGGKLEVTLKEVELGIEDLKDQTMSPGPYACLTVADTGTGMEKPVLDRIFDPYFTTKGKGEGTGLGLAVVHGIVTGYGGDIKVYSEPGIGTAFHVYLPVIRSQAEAKEIGTISQVPGGTEHILLVDDEDQIVRMVKQMLERLGYQVTVRTSSIDALEEFRSDPDRFDLVITDMTMPNMTGIQLSQTLLNPNVA